MAGCIQLASRLDFFDYQLIPVGNYILWLAAFLQLVKTLSIDVII